MFSKTQKEVVMVEKILKERIYTKKGGYSVWNACYDKGYFELDREESEKIQVGQRVELWFKPDRTGKARRNVAVYI